MPKLPRDLVKRTQFDNPLRRTTSEDLSFAADHVATSGRQTQSDSIVQPDPGGVVLPFARIEEEHEVSRAASMPTSPPLPDELDEQSLTIEHRITVRIDDATRRALETECHRRRIAGEKIKVAEIARSILAAGAAALIAS